jgi:hypothetical protein
MNYFVISNLYFEYFVSDHRPNVDVTTLILIFYLCKASRQRTRLFDSVEDNMNHSALVRFCSTLGRKYISRKGRPLSVGIFHMATEYILTYHLA